MTTHLDEVVLTVGRVQVYETYSANFQITMDSQHNQMNSA